MATPWYKLNRLPKGTTTFAEEAYYGGLKQKSRREAELTDYSRRFQAGEIDYGEYKNLLKSTQSRMVGYPERAEFGTAEGVASTDYLEKTYTELGDLYNRGDISIDEYIAGIEKVGREIAGVPEPETTSGTGAISDIGIGSPASGGNVGFPGVPGVGTARPTGAATTDATDYENIKVEFNGNYVSISDVVGNLREDWNVSEDTRMDAAYATGTVSFSDYANYLSGRLGTYEEGTKQYGALSQEWKASYLEELEDYYKQVETETGGTGKEWEEFLKWYGKKMDEGAKMVTDIGEFTYEAPEPEKKNAPVPKNQPGRTAPEPKKPGKKDFPNIGRKPKNAPAPKKVKKKKNKKIGR